MVRTSLLGLVLALSLAACSGGDPAEPGVSPSDDAPSSTSGTATDASEASLEVPDGVTPTEPGTALELGETATVAFPVPGDEVGVLDVRVDSVTEVTAREFRGWLSPQALDKSRPYFVEVRLTNVGETDLGGHDVPIHLLDDKGTLGPPWAFDGPFKPCQSGPLPKTFASGDKARMCLVYLAPMRAKVESMAFVPDADVEPVTWSGKVTTPQQQQDERGPEKKGEKDKKTRR